MCDTYSSFSESLNINVYKTFVVHFDIADLLESFKWLVWRIIITK